MVLKVIKGILWLLIIPELIGLGVLRFDKKKNRSIVFAWVLGYMIGFALFEILAVPMIFTHQKYTTLLYAWMLIEIFIAVLSLYSNWFNMGFILKADLLKLRNTPKILMIVFLLLIFLQCYYPFRYMHEDYDDYTFISEALTVKESNLMFKTTDTGKEAQQFTTRRVFSPFSTYNACISSLVDVHPAMLERTIYPILFIFMAYMVYLMIGNCLFKEDKEKTLMFLIILSLLYIFGNYSVYTNFSFLLLRIWQGKAILANIMIPFIWLIFLKYIDENTKIFYWVLLFIIMLASNLVSSMSLCLSTLTTAVMTIVWAFKDKKPSYIVKVLPCFIPSVIYGVIYLQIR